MIIGIDPNFSASKDSDLLGVSIVDSGLYVLLDKVSFLSAFDLLKDAAEAGGVLVLEKPTKNLHNVAQAYAAAAKTTNAAAAAKIIAKRASDIGALWYQARILEHYAASIGLKTITVEQTRRLRCDKGHLKNLNAKQLRQLTKGGVPGTKKYLSKLDAKRFNALTGWTKRSNEDARDAALLIIDWT